MRTDAIACYNVDELAVFAPLANAGGKENDCECNLSTFDE